MEMGGWVQSPLCAVGWDNAYHGLLFHYGVFSLLLREVQIFSKCVVYWTCTLIAFLGKGAIQSLTPTPYPLPFQAQDLT